jgi:hypothetical protein
MRPTRLKVHRLRPGRSAALTGDRAMQAVRAVCPLEDCGDLGDTLGILSEYGSDDREDL